MRNNNPAIIGGVGGSGTRLIAQIFKVIGYNMGNDFNKACDNLSFTLLFRRTEVLSLNSSEFQHLINILKTSIVGDKKLTTNQLNTINKLSNTPRPYTTTEWLKDRGNALINTPINQINNDQKIKWGWKEPNSHLVLKQLHKSLPEMKYIHVIRNGIDMAYSENQNQLKLWGKYFFNDNVAITPENSLKYWCIVHQNLLEYSKNMNGSFYLLNFDEFCQEPKKGVSKLIQFLKLKLTASQELQVHELIKLPKTIGRYKQNDLSGFDIKDITYVEQLGFDVKK